MAKSAYKEPEEKKVVSGYAVKKHLVDALTDYAKSNNRSRSDVVNEAVAIYLASAGVISEDK